MTQQSLFERQNEGINNTSTSIKNTSDLPNGKQLRDRGIKKVAGKNQQFLDLMRAVALRIFRQKGKVSGDDIRRYCDEHAIFPSHPNAFGAVFRAPGWKTIGFIKSEIPSTHARIIAEWIYVETE